MLKMNMLAYCQRDTEAMVAILKDLNTQVKQ
jgi:hypothetical protein